jgi:hypothetical protein
MAKFRKKPVVIEAWQSFNDCGKFTTVYPAWIMDATASGIIFADGDQTKIKTLEGDHLVSDGDWIIKGVKGEFYPIKDLIFRETYDSVADDE